MTPCIATKKGDYLVRTKDSTNRIKRKRMMVLTEVTFPIWKKFFEGDKGRFSKYINDKLLEDFAKDTQHILIDKINQLQRERERVYQDFNDQIKLVVAKLERLKNAKKKTKGKDVLLQDARSI